MCRAFLSANDCGGNVPDGASVVPRQLLFVFDDAEGMRGVVAHHRHHGTGRLQSTHSSLCFDCCPSLTRGARRALPL